MVAAAIARPKDFVLGIDYFLILATTLEVSLHALRFAPGSDRLLPPVRTEFSVASDDVSMSAVVADPSSGRIFLGARDGCIHEFQYFEDTRWLGRLKCRKSAVSWNLQSQLPAILQRACVAMFGSAEPILQLSFDVSRGLLFALSVSHITVFQVPPSQRDGNGRVEEKPAVQLSFMSRHTIANEVGRIKARLFPGLLPVSSRGLSTFGSGLVSGISPPRFIKVLPVQKPVGGNVIACVVAEDGTRIFLRGNSKTADAPRVASSITSVSVHHVRFLDANAPKDLQVKDALSDNGVTLLHCSLGEGDVVVALSSDLRVVAQRQGRGRSPWVNFAGTAEHVDIISLAQDTNMSQIFGIAALPAPLPKPIEQLFSGMNGLILPVMHLSELAKQQLVAAPRFMVISSIGAHILRRIQPLDTLRERLSEGQLPALQEFVAQYTAEQACALLFQILAQAVLRTADSQSLRNKGLRKCDRGREKLEPKGLPAKLENPSEEMLLLRAEQLLLSQLTFQLGLAQGLPSIESQGPLAHSGLGYSVMFHTAARLSARMRGLYLYLSRLLRPLWMSRVMLVAWPQSGTEKKRRRDEWWAPPPQAVPKAKGAQWQCAFSKSQRSFCRSQLLLLSKLLERCLPRLNDDADFATQALHLVTASIEAGAKRSPKEFGRPLTFWSCSRDPPRLWPWALAQRHCCDYQS